jgi:branched-chain amino acid transport system ATP-binding protein
MSKTLAIKNLHTGYTNKTILHDLSLSVAEGEVVAIIGQNGCGKSTLLKTIARAIHETQGSIHYGTINLQNSQAWDSKKNGISWFVQGGMIFPTLTVAEHFALALREKTSTAAAQLKAQALDYFPTLAACMHTRGGNLSGGQRQMLSFAMLLAQETTCWLLDEPTAGLSPEAVLTVTNFLHQMKQKGNKTMLLVEHNHTIAFALADRTAIIKDGTLFGIYTKSEFSQSQFLDTYLFN